MEHGDIKGAEPCIDDEPHAAGIEHTMNSSNLVTKTPQSGGFCQRGVPTSLRIVSTDTHVSLHRAVQIDASHRGSSGRRDNEHAAADTGSELSSPAKQTVGNQDSARAPHL